MTTPKLPDFRRSYQHFENLTFTMIFVSSRKRKDSNYASNPREHTNDLHTFPDMYTRYSVLAHVSSAAMAFIVTATAS